MSPSDYTVQTRAKAQSAEFGQNYNFHAKTCVVPGHGEHFIS